VTVAVHSKNGKNDDSAMQECPVHGQGIYQINGYYRLIDKESTGGMGFRLE
jgi:hypothetical protein